MFDIGTKKHKVWNNERITCWFVVSKTKRELEMAKRKKKAKKGKKKGKKRRR